MSCNFFHVMINQGDIMARQPRQKSETGIYHVMLKGIDERNIFMEEGDRKKFVMQMLQAREKSGFALLAYCLMDNHVHLLLEEKEDIGTAVKRITVGYVLWHNNKYGRSGHLFRNRFLSEAVENDAYLMTVARYIHQNPVKARLVKEARFYDWSSYGQYIEAYLGKANHIDTEHIMNYFDTRREFEEFMNTWQDDKCLGYQRTMRLTDAKLAAVIREKYTDIPLAQLGGEKQNDLIKDIYNNEATSIRQLSRILGVGKGIIERAL